ncbi:DUF433 domain-containing protein, partial [Leptospira sp. SA-E8]|uniref:DUF433 domain-containing protein n=1 Tax=Leptospira sp. SA-E8 TaxID=3422259 RepID=UPI003EBE24AC
MISVDPDVIGGLPCFVGTWVPIDNVLGSLEHGENLESLSAAYPFLTTEHGRPATASAVAGPVERGVSRHSDARRHRPLLSPLQLA